MSQKLNALPSGSLERLVRLPASDRELCPKCCGYGQRGHGRYPARIIKCWDCGGTGHARTYASRKPNDRSERRAEETP